MPYSDEEIIQKLIQYFPTLIWQLQGDKFTSSLFLNNEQIRYADIGRYLDGNVFSLVQLPGGYGVSIPRASANEIFERLDINADANQFNPQQPNPGPDPNADQEDIPQQGQPQWENEIEQNPPAVNPEPDQNEAPPSPRRPRNR